MDLSNNLSKGISVWQLLKFNNLRGVKIDFFRFLFEFGQIRELKCNCFTSN